MPSVHPLFHAVPAGRGGLTWTEDSAEGRAVRDEVLWAAEARPGAAVAGPVLAALRVLIARGGEAKRRGLHIEMVFVPGAVPAGAPLYAHYKNGYRAATCALARRLGPVRALPHWLRSDRW